MGTCTSQFNMWTPLVAILLSLAFESSIARLPPPININQLDYAAGREAVPKMREEDIPLKCGAWKKMDCNDWENNYVMIETPGYPAKYQNKDQCTWTLRIPKESGTWIYCEEFRLNKGDYLFVGKQRYYGEKSWASIEPTQKSTKQNLKLRFKSNGRDTNNGFKCWVTCWPRDPSQTPAYTTTTTTAGEDYWTTTTMEEDDANYSGSGYGTTDDYFYSGSGYEGDDYYYSGSGYGTTDDYYYSGSGDYYYSGSGYGGDDYYYSGSGYGSTDDYYYSGSGYGTTDDYYYSGSGYGGDDYNYSGSGYGGDDYYYSGSGYGTADDYYYSGSGYGTTDDYYYSGSGYGGDDYYYSGSGYGGLVG